MSGWADVWSENDSDCVGDLCPSASPCVSSYVQFLGESNCKRQVIGTICAAESWSCVLSLPGKGEKPLSTKPWKEPTAVTTVEGLDVVVGSDMGVEQCKVPVPP